MNILLTLLLTISPLFAQDFTFDKESGQAVPNYIAQLKDFRGQVFKMKNGNLIPVKKGTRFYKNDSVVTQEKSYAKIHVVDDTVLNLGENSEMNFAEFKFVDKNDRSGVFDFVKGQIRALVKNKVKKDGLQFKTKFAAMAVRGTELLINVHKIKTKEIAEFALVEGAALVTDDKNQNYDIKANDRIVIVRDPAVEKTVNESRPLSAEEIKYLQGEDTFLPFLDPTHVLKESPLYTYLHDATPEEAKIEKIETADAPQTPEQKAKWQENLKKLNDKLKEYQKPKQP